MCAFGGEGMKPGMHRQNVKKNYVTAMNSTFPERRSLEKEDYSQYCSLVVVCRLDCDDADDEGSLVTY